MWTVEHQSWTLSSHSKSKKGKREGRTATAFRVPSLRGDTTRRWSWDGGRLIAKLCNIAEVTVRPLSAVRRYDGLEQDSLDSGRQLGVEAVLDETVLAEIVALPLEDASDSFSGREHDSILYPKKPVA